MFEKKKTMKSYEEVVLGEMDGKWLENTTYLSLVRIFNAIKMKSQCKLKIFKENIGEEQKYLDLIYLLVNSRNDIKAV